MEAGAQETSRQGGKRVLLISGGYFPAPGGAANYIQTLAHLLTDQDVAESVTVFTERFPGEPRYQQEGLVGQVAVRRSMPWRATREGKGAWSLFVYLFQLLQMGALILREGRHYDAVFLHGSLVYRTGFLARVIGLARGLTKGNGPRYILDIRDPLMPRPMANLTERFDEVLACSRNVARDLANKGVARERIREIPIPLTSHPAANGHQGSYSSSFGLTEGGFAFVAHGFTPGKRTEEVVEAVQILREAGMELTLAVAGKARSWPESAEIAREQGWLHFLGSLPNSQVRGLMAECRIHVNVCDVESIGRGSLEAIAAGALTVLPPKVPEFEENCPEFVGTAGNPGRLAQEIQTVLARGEVAPYPIRHHLPEAVALGYRDLVFGIS